MSRLDRLSKAFQLCAAGSVGPKYACLDCNFYNSDGSSVCRFTYQVHRLEQAQIQALANTL